MANIKELYINGDKLSLGGEVPSDLSVHTLTAGTQQSAGSVVINGAQSTLTMTGSHARLDFGKFTDSSYTTLPGVQLSSNSNSQYGGGLILVNGKLLTDGDSLHLGNYDQSASIGIINSYHPELELYDSESQTTLKGSTSKIGLYDKNFNTDLAVLTRGDMQQGCLKLYDPQTDEVVTLTSGDLKALLAIIHNNN